jgi:uracil-DNA glycosylase
LATVSDYQSQHTWATFLNKEKEKSYFTDLLRFVESERLAGKIVYPPKDRTFYALKLTPLSNLKVLILGQDPYHGPNQAHGLSFSVPKGIKSPPSLCNIFKELISDLKIHMPTSGDLTPWAEQGVLLLNSVLTVESGLPSSHAKRGWENFTDEVIRVANRESLNTVFVLWGSFAQQKIDLIDSAKHLIIRSPHPSPLSASRGFFGSRPFSQINNYLSAKRKSPIDWQLL